MTSDQKKALKYWVFGVIVVSRLFFFIPEYLPNLVPEVLHNSTWLDMSIRVGSESAQLCVSHQFVDPLILGLITWLVGIIFFIPGARLTRAVTILWAPCFFVAIAWVFLYQQNANDLLFQFLDSLSALGKLFRWSTLGVAFCGIFYFFVLGVRSRFKDDARSQ